MVVVNIRERGICQILTARTCLLIGTLRVPMLVVTFVTRRREIISHRKLTVSTLDKHYGSCVRLTKSKRLPGRHPHWMGGAEG